MTKRTCSSFAIGVVLSLLGCNREGDHEPMTPASGTTLSGSESLGNSTPQNETGFMGSEPETKGSRSSAPAESTTDTSSPDSGTNASSTKDSDTPAPSSGATGDGSGGTP